MQWSLFLLILMGQCSFFTCHLYKYRFIGEKMTWHDAQAYCKEKHTDLATVFDMTDMRRLRKVAQNQVEAWIGLYNKPSIENWRLHWSLARVEYKENETVRISGDCVGMSSHERSDISCPDKHKYICYDEKNKTNKFYLSEDLKSWPEAQSYCREQHTDLVSGPNQLKDVELTSKMDNNTMYWIGLFKDNWWWSDESSFSFRHWDHNSFPNQPVHNYAARCAMTTLGEEGRWKHDDCSKQRNIQKHFFCYDDKVILIKQNKTWVEALYYCREKYYDLVSITNLDEQRWVQERAKNASTSHVWLGLRYTCTLEFWFWVSDKRVSYKNWASEGRNDDCDMSAAMERGGDHKWFKKADTDTFNFICAL